MMCRHVRVLIQTGLALGLSGSVPALAQVTLAAGYTPPNDDPSIRVGATIFTDYTFQSAPDRTDAAGNQVNLNQFQVVRAYLNVTGQVHHPLSFRITPDIGRETGTGSSLSGSST